MLNSGIYVKFEDKDVLLEQLPVRNFIRYIDNLDIKELRLTIATLVDVLCEIEKKFNLLNDNKGE